jgi:plastocyanin
MRFTVALALLIAAACSGGGTTTPPGNTAVLTSLVISAPGNTLATAGTMLLSATPKDQNGATYPATIAWRSGSNFVATITSGGLVSAVAGGQAYMIASAGTLKDSTLITVITGAYPTMTSVIMYPLSYSPTIADIAVGGTVQFVFPSQAHNVFFDNVAGKPANIPGEVSNQTVARVFNTKGTFGYRCTLHPEMIATVVVH